MCDLKNNTILELRDLGTVILKAIIGRGHYGEVWSAQLDHKEKYSKVAVKFLYEKNTVAVDFEREIAIMLKLEHRNIVRIIAHLSEPKSIIMEYVEHRSFLMYLSSMAPNLENTQLMMFSKDIACGMEYLGFMKILHRDLAARNVLVDQDYCVKISDFGLAMQLKEDYYTPQTERFVPYKW